MAIEGVTGISSSRELNPKLKYEAIELVIPVTDLGKAPKKRIKQEQEDSLQKGAISEGPSVEDRGFDLVNLEGQVKQANQLAESLNRSIRFFVDEESGRTAVNVVDKNTHQVIKSIPPEQFLDLVARVTKIAGIFFDEFA